MQAFFARFIFSLELLCMVSVLIWHPAQDWLSIYGAVVFIKSLAREFQLGCREVDCESLLIWGISERISSLKWHFKESFRLNLIICWESSQNLNSTQLSIHTHHLNLEIRIKQPFYLKMWSLFSGNFITEEENEVYILDVMRVSQFWRR